jgi:hypothetical protein
MPIIYAELLNTNKKNFPGKYIFLSIVHLADRKRIEDGKSS